MTSLLTEPKVPRNKVYFPPSAWWAGFKAMMQGRMHDGPESAEFARQVADMAGRKHIRLTASGRQSIMVSLKALGGEPGDEVLMPAYTCRVILWSILVPGLKPVLVDTERDTYNMCPDELVKRLTPRSKFILLTHMHGRPVDVERFEAIAEEHGLTIIEDAADGLGGAWADRPMGSVGATSIISFSLYKNLNALDGGALVWDDDALTERIDRELDALRRQPPSTMTLLKRFGSALVTSFLTHPKVFSLSTFWPLYLMDRFKIGDLLTNMLVTLDDEERFPQGRPRELFEGFANFQAAVALPQVDRVLSDNAARRENARYLTELIADVDLEGPAPLEPEMLDIFLNYVVRVPDGKVDEVISACIARGVDLYPGFVECLSDLKPYRDIAHPCPNAEDLMSRKLYLPVHPPLGPRDMRRIADALRAALGTRAEPSATPAAAAAAAA